MLTAHKQALFLYLGIMADSGFHRYHCLIKKRKKDRQKETLKRNTKKKHQKEAVKRNTKKKKQKGTPKRSTKKKQQKTAKGTECIQTAQEKTDAESPVSRPLYRDPGQTQSLFYRLFLKQNLEQS